MFAIRSHIAFNFKTKRAVLQAGNGARQAHASSGACAAPEGGKNRAHGAAALSGRRHKDT